MNNSKKAFLVILFVFMVPSMVSAVVDTDQIDNGDHDLYFTSTGNPFQDQSFVTLSRPVGGGVFAYFQFDNISIPANVIINDANLTLRAPSGVSPQGDYSSTVYGLLGSVIGEWNEDDISYIQSLPQTAQLANINISGLHNATSQNYSITNVIQELVNQYSWNESKAVGLRLLSPVQDYRWCYAFEGSPNFGAILTVDYEVSVTNVTYYYKGYTITYPTTAQQRNAYIKIGGGNLSLVEFNPTDWSKTYHVLPANKFYDEARSNIKCVFTGDRAYYIATNLTETHLWYANITDLDDWALVGEIGTNLVSKDAGIAHHLTENAIYCVISENSAQGIYVSRYFINNSTWQNIGYVHIGGGVASGNVDILYDPEYEFIHILGSYDRVASGTLRTRYLNYSTATGWSSVLAEIPAGGTGFGVRLVIFRDYLIRFAQDGANHYFSSRALSGGSWSAWTNIGSGSGYSTYYRTANRLVYIWSTSAVDQRSDWEEFDITLARTSGQDMNYTGQDQLYRVRTYYTNPQGTTFETWMLEIEQNDKLILFNNPDDVKTYPTDVNFWNSRTLSTHEVSGLGEVFVSGISTEEFNVTTPPNGTNPDPNCIALATTLEEVLACIDDVIGDDPQNPNPPESNYPPDGTGVITRFNLRYFIWLIAHALIFMPLWVMAYKTVPVQYYLMFVICMVTGLGLLWSIATI